MRVKDLLTNEAFERWFNNHRFELIDRMKPEFHNEYYCRSGYFLHQDILRNQEKEILHLKELIAEARNIMINDYDDDYVKNVDLFCEKTKSIGVL
jgi:hypothetical protein